MNILFIDEKSWEKKVAYTIHYLADEFVEMGHRVYAIDFNDTWRKRHIFDLYEPDVEGYMGKVNLNRKVYVKTPGFFKIPVLSRLSAFITHTMAIYNIIRNEKIDIVIIYSLMNAPAAILICKNFKIPLIFHSIDMLESLVPYRLLKKPAVFVECLLLRQSNMVFALTPHLAERAKKIGAKNVDIVCNGVDIDNIKPVKDDGELRKRYNLMNDKVILFVGTINEHTGLSDFIIYYSYIAKKGMRLLVVGDDITTNGKLLNEAKRVTRERGIDCYVVFTGLQPKDIIAKFINMADVCISTYYPSEFSLYNVQMKIFEFMAGGKPTIMFELPGTKSLIGENRGVIYVDSYDKMCKEIEELLKNYEVRKRLGLAARSFVEDFSWRNISKKAEKAIEELFISEGEK